MTLNVILISVINPEGREELRTPSNHAREANRGILINPMPNSFATIFMVGPKTFIRKLNLPNDVCRAWLNVHQKRIRKLAGRTLTMFPPSNDTHAMCLSLTEFFTESWRTIFIRSEHRPSPIVVGFRQGNTDASGVWTVINLPNSTSVVSGGFASYPVSFAPLRRRVSELISRMERNG